MVNSSMTWQDDMMAKVFAVAEDENKNPRKVAYHFDRYNRIYNSTAYGEAIHSILEDNWKEMKKRPEEYKAGDIFIIGDVGDVHDELAEILVGCVEEKMDEQGEPEK